MARTLIEEFLLFILPFCIFAGYLVARRRNPFQIEAWTGRLFYLAVAGLVLAIGSFVYAWASAERHSGAFVPPHVENGRLVPGQFDDRR